MSMRAGSSWQTSLADLSLILFMVTAGVVGQQSTKAAHPGGRPPVPAAKANAAPVNAAAPSPQTEPLSVYVAAPGAPPLDTWLGEQAPDPREQLTITARYDRTDPNGPEHAVAEARRLLSRAGDKGRTARVVVEPGSGPARAALAFDAPGGGDGTH